MPGSCASELQLKVNCRPKVNCKIKFGLAWPTVGRPAQFIFYNSLSAAIHLYMIRPIIPNIAHTHKDQKKSEFFSVAIFKFDALWLFQKKK